MPTQTIPTSPPAIHIDGVLNPGVTQDLLALTIEESVSAPARCTARFNNLHPDPGNGDQYRYFGLEAFNFGRRLAVWQGVPPVTLFRLFDGRIHLIEGVFGAGSPPQVVVQAEDNFQEFRMRERTRVFHDMSDAMILQQIAADHGLTLDLQAEGLEAVHAQVAQLNLSDHAFLLDRVMAAGVGMWIEQGALVVSDTGTPGAHGTLVLGGNLLEFDVQADLRRQATVVGVAGWDIRTRQAIGRSADDQDLPPGPAGARSGGRVLEEAFGRRVQTVVDALPGTDAEAESLAVAHHRRQSSGFLTGHGVALDVPGLRAGQAVEVQGIGPLFSGVYQVTGVRHLFDGEAGLRTEFEVRRDRIGGNPDVQSPREATNAHRDPRVARDPRTGFNPDGPGAIPSPGGRPTKGG